MDNNRFTKVLFWNIRGINSQEKCDALRDKINESAFQVLCMQETKREQFDHFYLKNSVQEAWILLLSHPPLEPLEDSSLLGILASLMEVLCKLTLMPLL